MQGYKSIGFKVQERKRKYEEDKKNPAINKAVWNAKKRKWVHPFTQRGYIHPTVRKVFKDLTDEPSDSKDFKSPKKFVSCCLEKLEKGEFDLEENCCKNEYCVMGAGAQKKLLKYNMLYLVILLTLDIVESTTTTTYFLSKAKQLYEDYWVLTATADEEHEITVFL